MIKSQTCPVTGLATRVKLYEVALQFFRHWFNGIYALQSLFRAKKTSLIELNLIRNKVWITCDPQLTHRVLVDAADDFLPLAVHGGIALNNLVTLLEETCDERMTRWSPSIEITHELKDIVNEAMSRFETETDEKTQTTSHLLVSITHLLATHPIVQEKLRTEIAHLERITPRSIEAMNYLTAVIQEGLRLYPPVPFILRKEKGTRNYFLINIVAMHRSSEYWSNPDEFRPERWLDERGEIYSHEAYIPFGAGSRTCVGKRFAMIESRVVLIKMLKRFSIRPTYKKDYCTFYEIGNPAFVIDHLRDRVS